ncbi:MAG TPA: hypothetical protein VI977_03630 [archaeon]|nr:hypothetical protein [archaeon]
MPRRLRRQKIKVLPDRRSGKERRSGADRRVMQTREVLIRPGGDHGMSGSEPAEPAEYGYQRRGYASPDQRNSNRRKGADRRKKKFYVTVK